MTEKSRNGHDTTDAEREGVTIIDPHENSKCSGLEPPIVPDHIFEAGEEVPSEYLRVEGGQMLFEVRGGILEHDGHAHIFPIDEDIDCGELTTRDEDAKTVLRLAGNGGNAAVTGGSKIDWWRVHNIPSEVIDDAR